ncbi:MAG: phosphatase PAP2 family protein [Nocardioidaceae bacterium]
MTSAPSFKEQPVTGDGPVRTRTDRRWLIGVWVVVALFAAITVAWSIHVDVPIRDPNGRMFVRRLVLSLGLFAAFCALDAGYRLRSSRLTAARFAETIRTKWTGPRLLIAVTGLLAYHLVYLLYHNLKSWVVFQDVQDDRLLRLDAWMLGGHSPAALLHDLLGQQVAAHVLAGVYEAFSYLVTVSFVACVVFSRQIRNGYVFLTSAIWTWILGAGAYYLIPSLGPFASAPEEFAGLSRTFIDSRQANLLADRAHLLQHPEAGDAFASIGAFASLHVGFTFMILLMMRYYGFRRATQAMTVFLIGTIVATLYFGYHFIIDDIAGLLLGYLAVVLGRRTVFPRGRPSP